MHPFSRGGNGLNHLCGRWGTCPLAHPECTVCPQLDLQLVVLQDTEQEGVSVLLEDGISTM